MAAGADERDHGHGRRADIVDPLPHLAHHAAASWP